MIRCPRCGSTDKKFRDFSLIKNKLMKVYWCNNCESIFKVTPQQVVDSLERDKKLKIQIEKESKVRHCRICGSTKYHAKGLCHKCYERERRQKMKVGKNAKNNQRR